LYLTYPSSTEASENLHIIVKDSQARCQDFIVPWHDIHTCSPYFATIYHEYRLDSPKSILFLDTDIEAFKHIVNWFECQEVLSIDDEPDHSEDIVELLMVYDLANRFLMHGLKRAVFDEIQGRCNIRLVAEFFPRVEHALKVLDLSLAVMERERIGAGHAQRRP